MSVTCRLKNSSEFFCFAKNRLADYSSFLSEELNKDLEVHSVAHSFTQILSTAKLL